MFHPALFDELYEPVETAAHLVAAAAGTALSFALLHPAAPLQPRPFYLLLALATFVSALFYTVRSLRGAEA